MQTGITETVAHVTTFQSDKPAKPTGDTADPTARNLMIEAAFKDRRPGTQPSGRTRK